MMITALAFATLLGAQQPPVAQQPVYAPESIRAGCGYVPGTDHLFPIEIGLFYDDEPPFADSHGQSVRVNGKWTHPELSPYTAAEIPAWYRDNEPITIDGREYEKYGLPRVLGIREVEWIAELDRLAVAAEPGQAAPEVVYLLVEPANCGFQPYQRKP